MGICDSKSNQQNNNINQPNNLINNQQQNKSKEFIEGFLKDVKNEDNPIISFQQLRKIFISDIHKCICKILTKVKTGTGFFYIIPEKQIKVLITNNHVIDEEYLNKENRLVYSITEMENEVNKEIDLSKKRYKLTNKKYDFTIIEILKEDKINNYLEINHDIFKNEDQIFSFEYPRGGKLQYSHGKISKIEDSILIYDVGADKGSSGSPIILMDNLKVIGLHKGYINDNTKEKKNVGIRMEYIIDKINILETKSYIKCIYDIKDNNYIQIINNRCDNIVNGEIEAKIKIWNDNKKEKLIFKKQFNKIGLNTIYFIIEEKLNKMSYMFYQCSSLKEINFISVETDQVTNMQGMFAECNELEYLDLSNFNISNVTDKESIFSGCNKLKQIKGEEKFRTSQKNQNITTPTSLNIDKKSYNSSNSYNNKRNIFTYYVPSVINESKESDHGHHCSHCDKSITSSVYERWDGECSFCGWPDCD